MPNPYPQPVTLPTSTHQHPPNLEKAKPPRSLDRIQETDKRKYPPPLPHSHNQPPRPNLHQQLPNLLALLQPLVKAICEWNLRFRLPEPPIVHVRRGTGCDVEGRQYGREKPCWTFKIWR